MKTKLETTLMKCRHSIVLEIMMSITGRKLSLIFVFCIVFDKAFGQLNSFYKKNSYACNCINIELKNTSADTVYIFSQSTLIYKWDTCFAYDVGYRNLPYNGYDINLTYLDYYSHYIHHNYMSVFPDSILRFGARSNSGMIKDSLFVSMYVYSMPIKKGEKIVDINAEIEKLKKGKKKVMKGWRSLYCSPR